MRRKVLLARGEMLSPLGNCNETYRAILGGQTGISTGHRRPGVPDYPMGMLVEGGLKPVSGSHGASISRLQMVLEKLIAGIPEISPDTLLILSTTKGGVDGLAEKTNPIETQPWSLGQWLCKRMNLVKKPLLVSGACASGTLALIRGAMEITENREDQVLVIGVDLIADFILRGFDSLKALSPTLSRPFDRRRDGLNLGEAAAWVLLSADGVQGSDSRDQIELRSWGISCDATHITAPCREASGLRRVLEKIRSFSPEGRYVGGINGHGTGTVYNDSMELLAFQGSMSEVPVCSTKGALGHSLGATGVVEALLCSKSLMAGQLPPTVGCEFPDEGGDVVTVGQAPLLAYPSILSCNSGFGGMNAGILLTAM